MTHQFHSLLPDSRSRLSPPVIVRSTQKLDELSFYQVADGLYIVGGLPLGAQSYGATRTIHVDGIGVFKGSPVSNESPIPSQLESEPHRSFIHVRGTVALYTYEPDRCKACIYPDFLGGAVTYIYETESLSAASTSITDLVGVLEVLNVPLRKSATWFMELLATESAGLGSSASYESITTLDCFEYLEADARGFSRHSYTDTANYFDRRLSYDEHLDAVVEDLRDSARGYSKIAGPLTAHLSAGADSRLSAASLVNAGVAEKFVFYCAGDAVSQETIIGRAVAEALGLSMTLHPGTGRVAHARNPFEELVGALYSSGGIKINGPSRASVHREGVILTGLYGELFRSFYSLRFAHKEKLTGRDMVSNVFAPILVDPEIGLLRGDAVENLAAAIDDKLNQARTLGIREDAVGDYLYATVRNRFFAAHTQMENSRYTLQGTTLYTADGFRMALATPLEQRGDGAIVYDLFKRLSPEALGVPFDAEKFGITVHQRPDYDLAPPVAADANPAYDDRKLGTSEPFSLDIVPRIQVGSAHVKAARQIRGVKAWQVAYEEASRGLIAQSLRQGHEVVEKVCNVDRVRALTAHRAGTRSALRIVNRLAVLLQWYNA